MARRSSGPVIAAIAIAVGAVTAFLAAYSLNRPTTTHDFLAFYAGASLAREGRAGELYNLEEILERQAPIQDAGRVIPFNRPPFYAVLLAPLALLRYEGAFWTWIFLQIAALTGCWIWAARRFGHDAVVFTILYPPAILGIAHGQDCAFVLAILIGSYVLAERGKHFRSGLLLGAGLVKFHLMLLWPLALLMQKRWRALAGFATAGAIGVFWSVALIGLSGIGPYIRVLTTTQMKELAPSIYKHINVEAFLANFDVRAPTIVLVLDAAFACFALMKLRKSELPKFYSGTLAATVVVSPHVFGYDATMLLLPLWLSISRARSRFLRYFAGVAASPVLVSLLLFHKPMPALVSLSLALFAVLLLVADDV